jgi:cyclophilin family peptidyl-prolyl cis-trans isomerase
MNDKPQLKKIIPALILIIFSVNFFASACESENRDSGFQGDDIEKDSILVKVYPEIFNLLIHREGEELLKRAHDWSGPARNYALQAIFHSNLEFSQSTLEFVKEIDHPAGWMMSGLQESAADYLEMISGWWREGAVNRSYACIALGQIGNIQTLEMLLNESDIIIKDPECALAAGRIISNHSIPERLKAWVASVAFETDETGNQLRLLYGFYRNVENRPETGSPAYRLIREGWINTGPETDVVLDQFAVRILGREAIEFVLLNRSDNLADYPNLSVEIARVFSTEEWTIEEILLLFDTGLPHVISELYQSLLNQETLPDNVVTNIKESFIENDISDDLLVEGVSLLQHFGFDTGNYQERIDRAAARNPYLTGEVLRIYSASESENELLNRVGALIGLGNIRAYQAMQVLVEYTEISEDEDLSDEIYEVFWKGVESGYLPVIQAGLPLISNSQFVRDEDLHRLLGIVNQFPVDEHFNFYIALADELSERFGEEIRPWVMTIAEEGFSKLNNSLRLQGWEIPDDYDRYPAPFRSPDWDQLYEMGIHPVWILETSAGRIEIKLDPLTAPATVSSIVNLTFSGAFNDVYFHRVVPNFVIQSGDVSGSTGTGGPGYHIPIEPSFRSFKRGMAGIASLGPDTEGSQFFFMNQWAPHLDGRYTIFGEVVSGMNLVNKIRVGDRIENAYFRAQGVQSSDTES